MTILNRCFIRIWIPLLLAFQLISTGADRVKKTGAGLLITSDGELLLLLRSPDSGHPDTWGLPGGNMNKKEAAIATALRESSEELGKHIPNYQVEAEIDILRGKKRKKLFTVFVVSISSLEKESFKPELNKEHVDFKWYKLSDISGIPNLHPIVKTLFRDHIEELANVIKT